MHIRIFLDDHRRRRLLVNHGLGLNNRRFLHDGDNALAYALLLKNDDVLGLQWGSHAVGPHVVEDEFFIHSGPGHVDYVGDRYRIGRNGASILLSDHSAISGILLVQCVADRGAA